MYIYIYIYVYINIFCYICTYVIFFANVPINVFLFRQTSYSYTSLFAIEPMFSGFFLQTGLFLLVSCKSIFLYGSFCKKACFCRFLLAKENYFLRSLSANEPIFVDLFLHKCPMSWQEGIYTNTLVCNKRNEKEVSFAKRDLQRQAFVQKRPMFWQRFFGQSDLIITHKHIHALSLSLSLTYTHIHGVD